MADNMPEWKRKHLAEQERRKKEKEEEERKQQEAVQKLMQEKAAEKEKQEQLLKQQEEERQRQAETERKKKEAEAQERMKLFAGSKVQQERSQVLSEMKVTVKTESSLSMPAGAPQDPLPSPTSPAGPPKDPLPAPASPLPNPFSPAGPPKDPLPAPASPLPNPFVIPNPAGGPPKDPLPSPTSPKGDNIPKWKQEQMEREEKRKQQEAEEARLKQQKLASITPSSPDSTSGSALSESGGLGSPALGGSGISKPKRNVRAPTSNPITSANNLANATQSAAGPNKPRPVSGANMSLASAGAAIAQKRSMSLYIPVFTELGTANQDESEGEWGKGKEEAQEAYQQYKAPALGEVAAFGFGQIDAETLRNNLKKTDGVAGDTHK